MRYAAAALVIALTGCGGASSPSPSGPTLTALIPGLVVLTVKNASNLDIIVQETPHSRTCSDAIMPLHPGAFLLMHEGDERTVSGVMSSACADILEVAEHRGGLANSCALDVTYDPTDNTANFSVPPAYSYPYSACYVVPSAIPNSATFVYAVSQSSRF
jgi:hypothetical protein